MVRAEGLPRVEGATSRAQSQCATVGTVGACGVLIGRGGRAVDDRTYRRMIYGCSCGHVARSLAAEARHRHNFPLLCRRPKVKKLQKRKERKV